MKAKSFGLILVLAVIVGSMLVMIPNVEAKSAKDGWKSSFTQYCKSGYTNLGACGSTSGQKWFDLLQRNDAANTTSGDCGDICSTNWFSTSGGTKEKTNPNDKISISGALKDSDKLQVWMYSSQRVNRKQNSIKSGQSTYELFVTSRIGNNFSIKGDKGKKKGYIDSAVGACVAGTPNPYTGPVVIQRPGIGGMSNLGKYGGGPTSIVNDGVQVYFNVGWLRKTAAAYKAGKISKYVNVFQGLFYHGDGASNASGCANIQLNAANIELVPTGDIYPHLSVMSVGGTAVLGSDTGKVQSLMTTSKSSEYQVASKAAVYDFTASSVNASKIESRFNDQQSTYIWSAGTNDVSSLCGKLSSLFSGGAISGIGGCSGPVEGVYSKATYSSGTTILDGSGKALKTGDKPAGTIMCRVIVTNNFNGDNNGTNNLRAGTPACYVVGKQPKIQIWGGDIRIGGDVDVSQSYVKGDYYGSWAEYGSFIAKLNQSSAFASGAALAGAHGASSNNPATLNRLTFANKTNDGSYGEFDNPSLSLPASQNSLYNAMVNNSLQIPTGGAFSSNLGNLSGAYVVNGNATISTSHIPANRTILIHVKGTATITGNITYPSSFNGIGDIPQVIIVANKINVKDSVKTIDAWLLAGVSGGDTGLINTCYNVAGLTTNTCKNLLTINGPVVSDNAKFRRTAGSNDTNNVGDPAERLNLRADSFLWEYNTASRHVIPTTVKVTQLPPRY